jgi:hypothetical protein
MNTLTRGIGCISNQVQGKAGDFMRADRERRVGGGSAEIDMVNRNLCTVILSITSGVLSITVGMGSRSLGFTTALLQGVESNMSN